MGFQDGDGAHVEGGEKGRKRRRRRGGRRMRS
jgi:hypothetical protein